MSAALPLRGDFDAAGPRRVNAVDLKYVLRKIDTDCDNFVHGRLLFPRG